MPSIWRSRSSRVASGQVRSSCEVSTTSSGVAVWWKKKWLNASFSSGSRWSDAARAPGVPALLDAAAEHVGRRLQVDDEVGRGDVGAQQLEQPLIDEQLVVVERLVGVDLVLVEQIVADRGLREQSACLSASAGGAASSRRNSCAWKAAPGRPPWASPSNGLADSSTTSAASSRVASRSASVGLADARRPLDRDVPMGQGSEVYLIPSARPVRIDRLDLRLLRLPFPRPRIARAAGGSH